MNNLARNSTLPESGPPQSASDIGPTVSFGPTRSFVWALASNIVGLVIVIDLMLLGAMTWQGITAQGETSTRQIQETLDRSTERLKILIRAAEMTAESAERAARVPEITSATLRSVLEHTLAAFEQRPELSYVGIALPEYGEYGTLERDINGQILLWQFPGSRHDDPVTRSYMLTDHGFKLYGELFSYAYDPRSRPFYQAALKADENGTWIPSYKWIVHSNNAPPLWGFSYVKAVYNQDHHLIGVLDTDFDLPTLNNFLRMLDADYHTHIQIIELGESTRLIGGSQIDRVPLDVPAEFSALINSANKGQDFIGKMAISGAPHRVATRQFLLKGDVRWLVITSQPAPLIDAVLWRQLLQVGGSGLILALLLLWLSFRMAKRFGRPMAELERRVTHFRDNQPFAPCHSIDSFRETHLLGKALDQMARNVEELITTKEREAASLVVKGAIFDSTTTAIVSLDQHHAIVEWNAAAESLFGLNRADVIGRPIADIVKPASTSFDWRTISAASEAAIYPLMGAKGYFDAEVRVATYHCNGDENHTLLINDISERQRAEQHIKHLANHDTLTGLANRAMIQACIVQAIADARESGRQLALLFLDLDRFKIINDAYGHSFGDLVLKAAADLLCQLVGDGGIVSRQGGDEFLILLQSVETADDVNAIAERITEALQHPLYVQERDIHLSVSVGISLYPRDGDSADILIDRADMAMYRAKDMGRNSSQFFTREISDENQRRVELETKLRTAVTTGQLQLVYQPKVSLDTGAATGCEALLRWNHPEMGMISPVNFIPIAEDSGLIVPIGDWVLRTACAQAKAWNDEGLPPLCVAVNISARQFLQQDVVTWVTDALHETGLPPEQLELELTESLIAQDVTKVIDTFSRLRATGVKLSIDDFGTGYSNLGYLKRFRVDTLKIDQSFVRDMLEDPDDATIVLAVIALAHNLNFKVIAEGVETAQHYDFLKHHGCDEIQGYYYSKPIAPDQMAALLGAKAEYPNQAPNRPWTND